ncbi:hypothetical protein [Terriglobus roseus]|uniref:Uncharacterized protein n=1 Tax=Terriglobus roseus TaxID=392734 RepID=A0A1H4KUA5_9BACT|nr:hypothetical protein [Terriglobus roseus]SEB61705.1 hypothetical protein SAMN05443244_1343 [Terriglobus roseus]
MSTQNPNTDPYEQHYTAPGASAAYDPATGAPYNPADVPPPPPAGYPPYGPGMPHVPNPLLAGLLGFIPGVGAMYNGQFAKGIAHIAIFAVLSSLADHVNGIFGLFVAGWIFYMVFEAYQTAVARRDGRPLPDPFGLNTIGDRFGFNSNHHPDLNNAWSQTVGKMPGAAPFVDESRVDPSGAAYYSRTDATGARATYQVDPDGSVYTSSSTAPPASGYAPPAGGYAPPASYGAPYGAPQYGVPPVPPPPPGYGIPPMPPPPPGFGGVPPVSPARGGLPTGAIWLIGLGFFALLGSLHPFAFLEGEATGGLFLIGLAVFIFWRQNSRNGMYPSGSPAARWNMLRASRSAGVVFIVGLLTLLQGLHVVAWHESWPFLLIFLGVVMVLERMSLNTMNTAAGYPGYPVAPEPPAAPPDTRAESPTEAESTSILPRYNRPNNDLSIKPDADDRGEGR